MECKQDGGHVMLGVNKYAKQNDSVTTIYIQEIHFHNMAQVDISCKTYFDGGTNFSIFSATNIPEYEYTWNISVKKGELLLIENSVKKEVKE